LGAGTAAAGDALVAIIPSIKPAVVAVGTFQRTRNPAFKFLGTGFAVGDGLRIATNAHVVPATLDVAELETLAIAIPRGDKTEVRSARAVATDAEHDVALLQIPGSPISALQLADEALVVEGQSVGFTGFPIGPVLGLMPVTHRGIVSAITPIGIPQRNAQELDAKLIRRLGDPFRVYQLDATAYPGNSGSPLYDPESGKVVGVINMVFVKGSKEHALSQPSGITYAIPVRYLKALLQGQ
jgi:S1-C subfamily serine protease